MTVLGYILVVKRGQRNAISSGGRGLENSRRRREFVVGAGGGGSGGIFSPKRLKSRNSEMVFSTFSMRYFSKKTQPV